jgi:DNA-binding response OmpR family regulator
MRVLLVEDDLQLGQALVRALEQEGIAANWAKTLDDAGLELLSSSIDLILLDLGLPDGDGTKLLRLMRQKDDRRPVIILTARESVDDRVRGLDCGADDYLAKPFAVPELLSRIRALIRRSAGFASRDWTIRDVTLQPENRRVMKNGQIIDLTSREFELVFLFMRHPGRVLTRTMLEESLSVEGGGFESNALEVYIHHLRRKLGGDFIRTVRGVGYAVEA